MLDSDSLRVKMPLVKGIKEREGIRMGVSNGANSSLLPPRRSLPSLDGKPKLEGDGMGLQC